MKVLYIGSDRKTAEFVKRSLKHEDFEVELFLNLKDASKKISDDLSHLVIIDAQERDQEACLELIKDVRTQNVIPVIMISSCGGVQDIVEGLNSGADAYLHKPFAIEELVARIKSLLRSTGQDRGKIVCYAGISFDPIKRKAMKDGEILPLTSKEVDLLELFMRNPGRIITRLEMNDAVWSGNANKFGGVINYYICDLRKKLKRTNCSAAINCVRGEGYIFWEEENL